MTFTSTTSFWMFRLEEYVHSMGRSSGAVEQQKESLTFASSLFVPYFYEKWNSKNCRFLQNLWMSRPEVGLDFHSMGRSSGAVEQQEEWSLAFTSSSLGNFAALTLVQTCEELPLKQTIQHSFPWLPFLTFKEVDSRIWCHISISDIILGSKVGKLIGFLD